MTPNKATKPRSCQDRELKKTNAEWKTKTLDLLPALHAKKFHFMQT